MRCFRRVCVTAVFSTTSTGACCIRFQSSSTGADDGGSRNDMPVETTMASRIPPTQPMGVSRDSWNIANLGGFPIAKIRNFSIIAHVDHGKTTLSDSILRRVGVLDSQGAVGTYMDKLSVERERGITIKAQTCSMLVRCPRSEETYLLNLIDTPGHADFQYEVSRSLAASEGAALLVDATQGVEAQTLANFFLAVEQGLTLVPVLSKLDCVLHEETVEKVASQIEDSTGLLRSEMIWTAARRKLGVEAVLQAVIDRVPAPKGDLSAPFRGLLFDAWTDKVNGEDGITCLVRVLDGGVSCNDVVTFLHSKKRYQVKFVGVLFPENTAVKRLTGGMVGCVFFEGVTRVEVNVGDTMAESAALEAVPGFKVVKPVIFACFYPDDGDSFMGFQKCVDSVRVSDPSVTASSTECPALGAGMQLGFLGLLHMQVFQERLFHEYGRKVLVTPPQVQYMYKDKLGAAYPLSVASWKWKHDGAEGYLEPVVTVTVVCATEHYGAISQASVRHYRGIELDMRQLDGSRVAVRLRMPLADLARGFIVHIKSISHGYAHLEYDEPDYEEADLVKIDIVINKAKVSALSTICTREEASIVGKRIVSVLRESLERSSVDLPIQAFVMGKCVARETIGALKKDVCAKIHAGDPTRKQKKLADQKKGKERMARRQVGTVHIDQDIIAKAIGATTFNS